MIAQFHRLLPALVNAGVKFVPIGGVAGAIHGAARATYDVDVVYERSAQNLHAIVAALTPFSPYLRDAPAGLPFRLDVQTLRNGLNFPLTTTAGDIDLLGEVVGGSTFGQLEPCSFLVEAFNVRFACVTLSKLIELKRSAGRPKDFEALAELEAIRSRN